LYEKFRCHVQVLNTGKGRRDNSVLRPSWQLISNCLGLFIIDSEFAVFYCQHLKRIDI
jgi:hypothetical protein